MASLRNTQSELFFGRLIKTKLPVLDSLLLRNNVNEAEVQKKIENKKERQSYYYNRNAKSLQALYVGDLVIFKKEGKEWHYGSIVEIVNDRSYIIKDSFDNHFRRNRRFIARTNNRNFNTSDLLHEANVKYSSNHITGGLKETEVVAPQRSSIANEEDNRPVSQLDSQGKM